MKLGGWDISIFYILKWEKMNIFGKCVYPYIKGIKIIRTGKVETKFNHPIMIIFTLKFGSSYVC